MNKQYAAYKKFFTVMQAKHNIQDAKILRKLTALGREAEIALYKEEFDLSISKAEEIEKLLSGEGFIVKNRQFNYRIDNNIQKIGQEIRAQYAQLILQLKSAMSQDDLAGIYTICNKLKVLLQDEACKTEVPALYFNKVAKNADYSTIKKMYNALAENANYPYLNYYCTGRYPDSNDVEIYLRTGCEMINSAFACIDNGTISQEKRESLMTQAQQGLDSLLTVQAESGVFPFPDMRKVNPWFAPMIEKILEGLDEKEYIQNGWIVKGVRGDGGLQFDNALCGSILIEGYKRFKNKRYLEAATRAGDWALEQDIVINFNYNAFSVKLLSELFEVTGNNKYLNGAIKKVRLGIMPGLCSSGRYFDGHNAKTVYHLIIVRGLLSVSRALWEAGIGLMDIEQALKLAIKGMTDEIMDKGANNQSACIQCFSLYTQLFGIDSKVVAAYRLCLNSIFYEINEETPSFKDSQGIGIPLSTFSMVIKMEELING
ncbi:MAG: hypothetical protein WC292_00715 [Clostridia bacterium]